MTSMMLIPTHRPAYWASGIMSTCQSEVSITCHVSNKQPITYQRHVEEDARGGGEDPGGEVSDLSEEEARHHDDVGEEGREEVVEDCLSH